MKKIKLISLFLFLSLILNSSLQCLENKKINLKHKTLETKSKNISENREIKKLILSGYFEKTNLFKEVKKEKINIKVIKYLLENGANPNIKDKCDKTPFHDLAENKNISLELVELFLKNNANPNIKNEYGWTPFHYLVLNKNISLEIVELLFKNNADPNIKDQKGFTPFYYLDRSENISLEIVELFLKNNANPNIKSKYDGSTPFHCLTINENITLEIAQLFLENGANPNLKSECFENTPFNYLAQNKNLSLELVELLLKNNADPNIKSENGKTTFHYLAENKNLNLEFIKLFYGKNHIENLEFLRTKIPYLQEDLTNIFNEKVLTDCKIESSDGKLFKVHKIWLETRLNKNIDEIQKNLREVPKSGIKIILNWIYTGVIPEDKNQEIALIETLSLFKVKNIYQKSERPGIVRDLKKLHKDKNSKDFTILVGEKEIKVHKFILVTFSNLYRSMFLSINENINQVNDYSGKSFDAIKTLIDFLYTDEIKEDINEEVLEEVAELAEYYQLNKNSMLNYYLEKYGVEK